MQKYALEFSPVIAIKKFEKKDDKINTNLVTENGLYRKIKINYLNRVRNNLIQALMFEDNVPDIAVNY